MARWLFKQEPTEYSFADLMRDGETAWEGVRNPLALRHLRTAAVGDAVLFYHTGDEKAVVGVAAVTMVMGDDSPLKLQPTRPLTPVPLAAIKADDRFAAWELVRQPRLSVMPVPDDLWAAVMELSGRPMGKRK
jgi:predicted RNA-binding protein with PUA-like domain